MTQDELKALVGRAALDHVVPGTIVGVGTGSTVNFFIDELAKIKDRIAGAVSSSHRSTERLQAHGIRVLDANEVESLPVYIDGADEIDQRGFMIKGGGAALTREKIVADLAERFVCIADASKLVTTLGRFPLPVEVIPMARAQVARRLARLGGGAARRRGDGQRERHPRRARAVDHRSARDGNRDQPVAGRRDGGHLRPAPGERVPAGHPRGGAHAPLLTPGLAGLRT